VELLDLVWVLQPPVFLVEDVEGGDQLKEKTPAAQDFSLERKNVTGLLITDLHIIDHLTTALLIIDQLTTALLIPVQVITLVEERKDLPKRQKADILVPAIVAVVHTQATAVVHTQAAVVVHTQAAVVVHTQATAVAHTQATAVAHTQATAVVHTQATTMCQTPTTEATVTTTVDAPLKQLGGMEKQRETA